MNKKDILFLCQYFYPEYNSSATLPFDTAKYLSAHGFSVDALVGYPKEYNRSGNVPINETVENVNISRIKYVELDRKKKINRLINYFSFTAAAMLKISKLKKYKCVIVYSNPPVLPIVPIIARKLFGTKFVFVAYDVYPEVAYASKTLSSNSLISRLMMRINHYIYKDASHIISLTDEMKQFLLSHRIELTANRVSTIANWAHEKEINANIEAYQRFGYRDGQFVVSYFGNLGTCQDIETMMHAAKLLKDDNRIKFLIIGHGNKKPVVESYAKELDNVQVLDFLTGKDFEQAIAISSCSIVSLERGLIGTCAPSKFYSYLQGAHPVLVVAEKESYLMKIVEKERIGCGVEVGDAIGLVQAIIDMVENREICKSMGENAKELYKREYDIEVSLAKYCRLMYDILKE